MPITKRLRYEVMRRDGHRCVYCGTTAKETALVIDHVVAVSLGGTDDPANLVTSCPDCNGGKSSAVADETFVARVNEDTQRWQQAMVAAIRIRTETRAQYGDQIAQLDNAWRDWRHNASGEEVARPENWRDRAESFLLAGLPIDEMIRLVTVAMAARTRTNQDFSEWRYFVGCCKNVMLELEGTARRLLETQALAEGRSIAGDGELLCPECEVNPGIEPGAPCIECDAKTRAELRYGRPVVPPTLTDL